MNNWFFSLFLKNLDKNFVLTKILIVWSHCNWDSIRKRNPKPQVDRGFSLRLFHILLCFFALWKLEVKLSYMKMQWHLWVLVDRHERLPSQISNLKWSSTKIEIGALQYTTGVMTLEGSLKTSSQLFLLGRVDRAIKKEECRKLTVCILHTQGMVAKLAMVIHIHSCKLFRDIWWAIPSFDSSSHAFIKKNKSSTKFDKVFMFISCDR